MLRCIHGRKSCAYVVVGFWSWLLCTSVRINPSINPSNTPSVNISLVPFYSKDSNGGAGENFTGKKPVDLTVVGTSKDGWIYSQSVAQGKSQPRTQSFTRRTLPSEHGAHTRNNQKQQDGWPFSLSALTSFYTNHSIPYLRTQKKNSSCIVFSRGLYTYLKSLASRAR